MKNINDYINEGIFNINKDLTPFEIARALKDYQYNTTDGGKDCLGQPLKEGDLILVTEDAIGHSRMCIGVYVQKKGRMVEYWASDMALEDTVAKSLDHLIRCYCNKVVKLNKDSVKL